MSELPNEIPNGVLLVDKCEGWTSHDVVAKARRALGTRKIGHAGTLDPMATGLLMLGVGPATRLLTHLLGLDKRYTATIRLGQTTVSDDRESEVTHTAAASAIRAIAAESTALQAAIRELTGQIEQVPSAVSAIKVGGKRAYDRVRAGETVELKKRPVTVHRFELGEPALVTLAEARAASSPELVVLDVPVAVHCSSGTYIRALARDLGAKLGVGGHLTALRRTAVGPFELDQAVSTETLAATGAAGDSKLAAAILTPAAVAEKLFPTLQLSHEQARDLWHGKRIVLAEQQLLSDGTAHAKLAAALAPTGRLVGLVRVKGGSAVAVTNFPAEQITQDQARGKAR